MTYIVVSENEIVKAEMERPEYDINHFDAKDQQFREYRQNLANWVMYEQHCLSLPRIPAPGHKWKLWDEVVENVDFKFKKQSKGFESGEWEDCTDLHYSKRGIMSRRIVAIPIQNKIVKEDMICPETGKYCDDECCTVGSICNVSGSTDGISPQPTPEQTKSEQGEKPDCSRHKKELFGQTDMRVVAEAIGDLHYKILAELLGRLGVKLYKDGLKDRMNHREQLGYEVSDASDRINQAALHISKAWQISKPYMTNDNTQTK